MNNTIFSLSKKTEDLPLSYTPHFFGISISATLDITEQEIRLPPLESIEVSYPFPRFYPAIFQTITLP
jgi:hypothetical protein